MEGEDDLIILIDNSGRNFLLNNFVKSACRYNINIPPDQLHISPKRNALHRYPHESNNKINRDETKRRAEFAKLDFSTEEPPQPEVRA